MITVMSVTPNSVSSSFSWRDKAGCVTLSLVAAAVSVPVWATSRKYRKTRSSISLPFVIVSHKKKALVMVIIAQYTEGIK